MTIEQLAATPRTMIDSASKPDRRARRHANRVLVLLTVALALNYLDRSVISVLLDFIKHDLLLSDRRSV